MISFEFAKKLKDAGLEWGMSHYFYDGNEHECREEMYPTLSELIEACGAIYSVGERHFGFHVLYCEGEWFAQYDDLDFKLPSPPQQGRGSTPEEAVSNLWLELNKKNE